VECVAWGERMCRGLPLRVVRPHGGRGWPPAGRTGYP